VDGETIWGNVKTAIKREKTTQKRLVVQIGESLGNFQQQIHHNRVPDAVEIYNIAKALHTTVEYLVTGNDGPDDEHSLLQAFRHLNETGKDAAIGAVRGLEAKFPLPSEAAGASSRTAT
jgi:hypothetical protein